LPGHRSGYLIHQTRCLSWCRVS